MQVLHILQYFHKETAAFEFFLLTMHYNACRLNSQLIVLLQESFIEHHVCILYHYVTDEAPRHLWADGVLTSSYLIICSIFVVSNEKCSYLFIHVSITTKSLVVFSSFVC